MAHDTGKQAALGRVLVALSAVAWSTAGIFTKGVEADVWTVLLWRGLLAGGVMWAWLVWRRGQAGLADWKHLGWAGWSAATVPDDGEILDGSHAWRGADVLARRESRRSFEGADRL